MSSEYSLFFTYSHIPQTKDFVPTSTCDSFSIRTECYAIDPLCMSSEYFLFFPCSDIPQTKGVVRTSTCECVTIRTERYAKGVSCMSSECSLFFPCSDIPQTEGTVPISTCEHLPIRTKRYAYSIFCMSSIYQFSTCLCIVYPNTDATCHCQFRAVWGICNFTVTSFAKPRFRAFG